MTSITRRSMSSRRRLSRRSSKSRAYSATTTSSCHTDASGNLVLCAAPDVPVRWRAHDVHRLAVALAPRHYHWARLHSGTVRSQLLGDAELVVLRTRYYDFDSEPAWLAVRARSRSPARPGP